jgi:hypothetical protein
LKEHNQEIAEKALALDLRIKILNNEICDYHSPEKQELQAFKMSMLPYLKSFNVFFRQLISLSDQTSVEHISSLFLKIWSVISLLVAME